MIEIIYNEASKGNEKNNDIFHIPKNIRQVGESREHLKIYMEDYAYTFLKRMSRQDTENGCAAILLGEAKYKDGVSYIFVKSALKIDEPDISAEHMPFSDAVWGEVHKEMEKFFPEQEIVGWSLSLPGFNMKPGDIILRAHLNHFAGEQKVLFVMEPAEKEEAFFSYENSNLNKQSGYYIYYEKNEPMQTYMVERGGNSSIEDTEHVSDRAVIDFRKIVSGKKEGQAKQEKNESFAQKVLYGVSACSVIALLVFGITFFNNYNSMEDTISKVTGEVSDKTSEAASTDTVAETQMPEATTSPTPEVTDVAQTSPTPEDRDSAQVSPTPAADATKKADEVAKATPTAEPTATPLATPTPVVDNSAAAQPDNTGEATDGTPEQPTASLAYQRYIVQKGDTLTQISERYYGTIKKLDDICEANNLAEDDIIYAGQVIVLP